MATSIGEAARTTCGDTQMIAEYILYNKEGGGDRIQQWRPVAI